MLESQYQTKVMKRIRDMFPGCVIQKLDANYQQGMLDWLILFEDRWATLEIKQSKKSKEQPNQPWWVETLNGMSFAAFIYPENEEEVLHDLQSALAPRRTARLSKRV